MWWCVACMLGFSSAADEGVCRWQLTLFWLLPWARCCGCRSAAGYSRSRSAHLSAPHPQVLHARTCTGTERQLVHLVAACHLIFSVGCDNMHLALDMLPPLRPLGTPSGKHSPRSAGGWAGMGWGGGGMHASDSNASLASETGASGGARSMRSR